MQVWTHLTLRNSIEKPLLARLAIYMYTCHHWPFIFKELWGELSLDPRTESVLTWCSTQSLMNSHESWVVFRILRGLFSYFLVGGWTNPSEKYSSNWMTSPIFGVKIKNIWNHNLHPWRLTWNIIMDVWKIIFLCKWVICRFHVNLPGWT